MKRLLIFPIIFVLACATSGLALKQKATTTLQASEVTLHDLRVSELAFYTGHTVASYTTQKHLAFLDILDNAQIAEKAVSQGLIAWVPSQTSTAPATASDYVRYAQAMVDVAIGTGIPNTHDFLVEAQKVLKQAQDALNLINGVK